MTRQHAITVGIFWACLTHQLWPDCNLWFMLAGAVAWDLAEIALRKS